MATLPVSRQMAAVQAGLAPFLEFITQSAWAQRGKEPGAADFVLGNPHDMPLPAFVEALQRWSVPQDKDWFAYKMSEPAARAAISAGLRARRGVPFEDEDIFITNGAFAAIAVALRAVLDPGDEVIFLSPPWFFYDLLIRSAAGVPVSVPVDLETFDLDLEAIAAAITPRTRAILVNSPHNPTGQIYPPETLERLARVLAQASTRNDRAIYLLSDEAYSRIVFDGQPFHSPTAFYPSSFLLYTYGKTLLTPGQRLGYIALPPNMPEREAVRGAVLLAQVATGYAMANALLQHALPDLETLSIDVDRLQSRRDRMVKALREQGYRVHSPQGTFYLLPRSPLPDDRAFVDLLASREVFVLPGSLSGLPGSFRISLTANEAMIERALPAFAAAIREARVGASSG